MKLAREFEIRVDACVLPVAVAQPEDESDLWVESWLQMRPPFEDLLAVVRMLAYRGAHRVRVL